MSAQASKARLAGLLKQLVAQWEQTHTTWDDGKAREFYQRYLAELIAEVEKTLPAMDALEKLSQRVREDCE